MCAITAPGSLQRKGISAALSAPSAGAPRRIILNWSEETALHPNEDGEHLYTNQTSPYFRAPHIYISLPTRFMPERGESTDILLMTSRPSQRGPRFDRTFRGAFIRPGPDPARWGNRSNYTALNVVPTGEGEMSIYLSSNSIKEQGRRLVLRTDGFAALHAGWEGGEMLTRPLTFSGSRLEINFATSAAGSLQVEIQTADGAPIPGYSLADCPPLVGDQISRMVIWGETGDCLRSGRPARAPALRPARGRPVFAPLSRIGSPNEVPDPMNRPNILFILTDDQGAWAMGAPATARSTPPTWTLWPPRGCAARTSSAPRRCARPRARPS